MNQTPRAPPAPTTTLYSFKTDAWEGRCAEEAEQLEGFSTSPWEGAHLESLLLLQPRRLPGRRLGRAAGV